MKFFEAFKRDVTDGVVPATAYATRLRRQAIDFAAKIVRTSGRIVLKVTAAIWDRLQVEELWALRGAPQPHERPVPAVLIVRRLLDPGPGWAIAQFGIGRMLKQATLPSDPVSKP